MAKQNGSPHRASESEARVKGAVLPDGRATVSRVPTVLVVDGDRVSRRFVELALAANPDFLVEVVNNAQSAFELMATQIIDVIVAETVLPDIHGLQFYRKLTQESRLRDVPFVFLSADTRPETKVVALRSGVDDYLCKPCAPSEFVARISAILERQRRRRSEVMNKGYTLAGDFSTMAFTDLVSTIELGLRTGVLAVSTRHTSGRLFFENGRIVHVLYGTLSGEEAFYELMTGEEGEFGFTPMPCTLEASERTVTLSATALIMEGARRYDDARQKSNPSQRRHFTSRPACTVIRTDSTRVRSPEPSPIEARYYEVAVRESFTLGDLRLFSNESLVEFTLDDHARHRFHVWLIAARDEGVSVLLPLAGAPSERLLLESLEPGSKVLGLTFDLRDERLLDVLLIDAESPENFKPNLRRCPSVVIFAPPHGDVMALAVPARLALKELLDEYGVSAIIGVGLPTLEDGLTRIGIASTSDRIVCCLRGVLGDPSAEMRRLLLHAIRLWLSSACEVSPNTRGVSA